MKKITILFSALALFHTSASVANNLEPHMYMGVSYSYASVDSNIVINSDTNLDFSNSLLGGIIGYQFHKNFALEARGYGSVTDDSVNGYKMKISNHFNILAKAIIPINEEYFKAYGILGYGQTKINLNSESESEQDILYGVGFSFSNHNPISFNIEWLRSFDDKSFDIPNGSVNGNMFNVNLVYHFDQM